MIPVIMRTSGEIHRSSGPLPRGVARARDPDVANRPVGRCDRSRRGHGVMLASPEPSARRHRSSSRRSAVAWSTSEISADGFAAGIVYTNARARSPALKQQAWGRPRCCCSSSDVNIAVRARSFRGTFPRGSLW
jgi:hypothetical protein